MKMRKRNCILTIVITALLAAAVTSCGSTASKESEYKGIQVASPDWVANLDAAASADQMLVVAAFNETATDAWVSLHEKQADGTWKMVMTTPGFIGKNGLGKTKEGDAKTPTGVFHFNRAFGIADDPGCAIPYVKVTDKTYWSGDEKNHYNEMVDLGDCPDLDLENSEHIVDYDYEYQYCLNISFNEDGTAGKGSAIFLHCLGSKKPYTGGCVAVPENIMKLIMRNVREDCVVVIDTVDRMGVTF